MDGILPLWKPKGMTSHDCVMKLRGILHTKKVGHTGTLDPEVEGVLPMCIGQATKIASYVTESEKVYEAKVTLGYSTETEDATGAVVHRKAVKENITSEEIGNILTAFQGEITQITPMYSAVRVDGKRLYEYAREGITVERPKRNVVIHTLELLEREMEYGEDTVSFYIRIVCSKGTYIRTLCVDIGEALGYPAHMSSLIRTASGSFEQSEAYTFETIQYEKDHGDLMPLLKPMDRGVKHLSSLTISDSEGDKVYHGTVFPKPDPAPSTNPFTMVNENGKLLAIYQIHPEKPHLIKPVRVFHYDQS
ncbi:tRNA pseudouridine(55) synthase TruB [Pontibacillus salicampi]|uniref:tRNA pseudouridine synthase B n=1 Tax=Pontibacillus salicampi TaxID=1449801 RepID=A0ABV6LP52_9BACI